MDRGRLRRGLTERMLVVDASFDEEMQWRFLIQASSGRSYSVFLAPLNASCECHDCSMRQLVCKHIVFVLGRVAGLGDAVGDYLESEELVGQPFVSEVVHGLLVRAVTEWKGSMDKDGENEKEKGEEETEREEPCAVCLEAKFKQDAEVVCHRCAKVFHLTCMQGWWAAGRSSCPTCRASLPKPLFAPMLGEDSVFLRF